MKDFSVAITGGVQCPVPVVSNRIDSFFVGQRAEITKTLGVDDLNRFIEVSGDNNPLHIYDEHGVDGRFSKQICHGLLIASYISAVLGTKLPGPGTIYMGQKLSFRKPVYIGDTVTACAEILSINKEKAIITLKTDVVNQNGDCVIDGEAVVKVLNHDAGERKLDRQGTISPGKMENANSFYSAEELKKIGLKRFGTDVKISRKASIYRPEGIELGSHVRIDDFSFLLGRIKIGDYVHVAPYSNIVGGDAGVTMEDYSGLSSRVSIYAVSDDYSGLAMTNPTVPAEYANVIKKPVIIKKHAIIGASSVILPGVVVEEGTSCGAMTLIKKSTEPWGVYAGNPCKRIKDRKKDLLRYEEKLTVQRGG